MRKFLSLCLSLMLILSSFPAAVSAAGEPDIKWLAKAETTSQAESIFKDKTAFITAHSENDDQLKSGGSYAGLKVTKLSNVAVRWANPQAESNPSLQIELTGDTTAYSHINFWLYAKGDFSSRMYQVFEDKTSQIYAVGFRKGWNLVSIPILKNTSNLTAIQFTSHASLSAIIPSWLPNGGSKFGTQQIYHEGTWVNRHYMDSMWLSKSPAVNTLSDMNVKNNANLVLTDIGTINIKAPGIVPSSISSSKISVSYCAEGTHDEANHIPATLIAGTDYSLDSATDTLKINFANELQPGTTYTVKITGATHYDNAIHVSGSDYNRTGTTYLQTSDDMHGTYEMPFGDYSLTFRTKGVDENFPPEVSLVSPVENERFYPGDDVSIKALANDADGTIEKVEFYADGAKIGEDSVPTEGIYEYNWKNAPEKMSGYEITAVAIDDKGDKTETNPVNILLMGIYAPEVNLESPTEDITVVRNYSGISSSTDVEVKAKVNCFGTTPTKVEFQLDGETVHTITNDASGTYTYTYTNVPLGTHSICVLVTDSEGSVGNSDTRYITCTDYGKKIPALAEFNFEEYQTGSELDWTCEGTTGEFTVETVASNNAAKIETANPATEETVSIQKRYRPSLSSSSWEITAKIMPMDNEHERTYTLSGSAEDAVVTFAQGGDILVGGTQKGSYTTGEWTEVRYIVDPVARTSYCLVNDVLVQTKTGLALAFSSNGATIKLSQKGISGKTGYCLLDDVGIYKLDITELEAEGIKVCDSTGLDLGTSSVPLDASYIQVLLNETLNNESIKNNIQVTDTSTGRNISLVYSDGKAYFNEVLKSNNTYNVLLTTLISSQSGTSLAKSESFSFTTAADDVEISNASFSESELSAGVTSVTFSFDAANNTLGTKDMYAVGVVYDGNKQAGISVGKLSLAASSNGTASVTVPVTYTDNAFIEVYIVDDMQTMNPVSNTIYKLN